MLARTLARTALAVALAACASSPARAPSATAHGPYIAEATGDSKACRPGYLVVDNGESYPVRLIARPEAPAALGASSPNDTQELALVQAGRRDTLVDLRRDLRYVQAVPDQAHEPIPAGSIPAANQLRHVSFSCTVAAR